MRRILFTLPLCALALAGCDFAPHYVRPGAPVPPAFPSGGVVYPAATDQRPGLAWQTLVSDTRLQALITKALADNRDLRQAVANVASARAQYRSQRSNLLPTIGPDASASITGKDSSGRNSYSATLGFSAFEIDLFGRQRDLTRAAFETYLASDAGARSARITLVAELATAWVTFAADSDLLAVAKDTVASAGRSLELTRELDRAGLIGKLDVNQAETIEAQARSDVENYSTQVEQDRNALQLLVGSPIDAAQLPRSLAEIESALAIAPAGLSSDVLLQRPDVLQAEHQLQSANANIGAARAAFFPNITLTSGLGFASTALSTLFTGGAFAWQVAPSATMPIFGGPTGANLAYAKAQRDYYLAGYEKAIQSAFRDVSNALARRGTIDRQRAAQRQFVQASEKSLTLSTAQYRAGIASYLTTLTSQRTLYAARQSEIATILADLSNRVDLYSAVGADDPGK
ncbi:efflux transporter outer membrane subunit [Sphingomonas sp. MMS24-J13]|uniref:efflux transporter outer membrane subunit n=1 Tax=Sphingomonas sp. MMS24-J13 TaxID=3238686 RepID=UPI00384D768E